MAMKKKGYRNGGKVKKMSKGGAAGGKKVRRMSKGGATGGKKVMEAFPKPIRLVGMLSGPTSNNSHLKISGVPIICLRANQPYTPTTFTLVPTLS